jgi:hypothetical protein
MTGKGVCLMGQLYRVAIHYASKCGYIEYDQETHKILVALDDETKKTEVEDYLSKEHIIRVAEKTLLEFKQSTGFAAESVASLTAILSELWVNTSVYVDWSRPVEVR